MRKTPLQTDEYYHIYNRGVDKRNIFIDNKDYARFLTGMKEFNQIDSIGSLRDYKRNQTRGVCKLADPAGLVEIISYCLNTNHYHFIIKQIIDNGIPLFIGKLANGYTKYFNTKNQRFGRLFQGPFQAIKINNYGYLLKILVYVNCNYEIHGLGKSKDWVWSSFLDSIGIRQGKLCNLNLIKDEFKSPQEFQKFCHEIIPEIKNTKIMQKYLLE